jgi:hypothetical protein
VIDVLHGQVEFVLMAFRCAAVNCAAIGKDAVQWNLVLPEEWQHPVIE